MSSIYLSARYGRRGEMAGYADELEALGHIVTSRWVRGDHEDPDETDEGRARWAFLDFHDLLLADTLVAFTEGPDATDGAERGGRHVELGIALALWRRVVVVGPAENAFYCLGQVRRFPDWPFALAYLEANR